MCIVLIVKTKLKKKWSIIKYWQKQHYSNQIIVVDSNVWWVWNNCMFRFGFWLCNWWWFFLYSFWVSSFIMVGLLLSLLLWQNYCIVKLCGRNGDGGGGGGLLQHFYIIYIWYSIFLQLFPILLLFFTITTTAF